jgi:4-hydroxy-tetrahydrodipicolinate synthase
MNQKLRGIAAPLVTPGDHRGDICENSVKQLIADLRGHVTVLMPTLSSGEGWKLDDQQWQTMLTYTVRHADGLPVFPGIIVDDDAHFARRANVAKAVGAAGVTLPVPSHETHDAAATLARYQRLAALSPLPIFVYNSEPTDTEEALQTLIAICNLPNVIAVKESSRKADVAQRLLAAGVRAAVFQGWEDLCLQSPGVDGYAIALVNLEPALCKAMWQTPQAGQQQQIDQYCDQYRLFDDAWYVGLKSELVRRQTISSARIF